jgi:predicted alpha/beta hydrolase family esterase
METSPVKRPTVLIVPGLRDHVPEHWQTYLQQELERDGVPVACVPRRADEKLSCSRWVEALEQSIASIKAPVVLCAHSGGVMIVAHWARSSSRPIEGALLATPADLEIPLPPGYPTYDALRENGWLPIPRDRLPFRSLVAASDDDPLGRHDRVLGFAHAWGAQTIELGRVGHLNPAAGYGPWPRARELLRELGAA